LPKNWRAAAIPTTVGPRAGARDDRIGPAIDHLIELLEGMQGAAAAAEEVRALLGNI
jgi:hypothetical protein